MLPKKKKTIHPRKASFSVPEKKHKHASEDDTDFDLQSGDEEKSLTSVVLQPWGGDEDDTPVSFDTIDPYGNGMSPIDMRSEEG